MMQQGAVSENQGGPKAAHPLNLRCGGQEGEREVRTQL